MTRTIKCQTRIFGTSESGAQETETRLQLPSSLTEATARDVIAAYVERRVGDDPELPRRIHEACEAVRSGQVLFFWNHRQITDLDETLPLVGQNTALFIHLIPLQGG